MQLRELSVQGAWEVTPILRGDDRGVFLEWYRFDRLEEAVGHRLDLRQANASVSAKGVVRGIHFADLPKGQAKYVTVMHGAIIDYVVDIRVGSPTFGQWDSVRLDSNARKALYLAEGLGHCFVSLTDGTVVSYLVSDVYNPAGEHGVNPLDPELALDFPAEAGALNLSSKDLEAPSLAEAASTGLLPTWNRTQEFYSSLNESND